MQFREESSSLNGATVSIPKTFAELVQDPSQLARVERLLQAMQNLTVSVTFNGVTKNYPVQFGESNALIDIRLS